MSTKIKKMALWIGYVESNSNACLLVHNEEGFPTVREALAALGKIVRSVIDDSVSRFFCEECAEHKADSAFCPKCGNRLDGETTAEHIATYFLEDIFHGDSDGTYDFYEAMEAAGWEYGASVDFDKEDIVTVPERAEDLIAYLAVGDDAGYEEAVRLLNCDNKDMFL